MAMLLAQFGGKFLGSISRSIGHDRRATVFGDAPAESPSETTCSSGNNNYLPR